MHPIVICSQDADKSGKISWPEFQKLQRKVSSLLMAPFTLQRNMQAACMGASYWNSATKRRDSYGKGEDLIEMFYRMQNEGRQLNRKSERKESRGKARQFVFVRRTIYFCIR